MKSVEISTKKAQFHQNLVLKQDACRQVEYVMEPRKKLFRNKKALISK